jgi:hypothetical protein
MTVAHEAEVFEASQIDALFHRRDRFMMRVKLRRMPKKPGWLRIPKNGSMNKCDGAFTSNSVAE